METLMYPSLKTAITAHAAHNLYNIHTESTLLRIPSNILSIVLLTSYLMQIQPFHSCTCFTHFCWSGSYTNYRCKKMHNHDKMQCTPAQKSKLNIEQKKPTKAKEFLVKRTFTLLHLRQTTKLFIRGSNEK